MHSKHKLLICATYNTRADTWSEQLLKSLYYTTLALGQECAQQVERLWTTVASNKRNIIPILDFLITRGLQEIHSGVRLAALLLNRPYGADCMAACSHSDLCGSHVSST